MNTKFGFQYDEYEHRLAWRNIAIATLNEMVKRGLVDSDSSGSIVEISGLMSH
jgi:hypothetical protein